MKYMHLFLISALVPTVSSAMLPKTSSLITKKRILYWIYPEKTIITFPENNYDDNKASTTLSPLKAALEVHDRPEIKQYSPRKNILPKKQSFDHYKRT